MKKIECLAYDKRFIFDNFNEFYIFMRKTFEEDENLESIQARYLEDDNE